MSEFCVLNWMIGEMDFVVLAFCVLGKSHKFYAFLFLLFKIKVIILETSVKQPKATIAMFKFTSIPNVCSFPMKKLAQKIFDSLSSVQKCFKKITW